MASSNTPPTDTTQLWNDYLKNNTTFKNNMKRCLNKSFEDEDSIDELNRLPNIICNYPPPRFITDYYLLPRNIEDIKTFLEVITKVQGIRLGAQAIIIIFLGIIIFLIFNK